MLTQILQLSSTEIWSNQPRRAQCSSTSHGRRQAYQIINIETFAPFQMPRPSSVRPNITSQSELSSNNGQATKTFKEPVYWSPYPGWEVPQSWGPGFRGEALLPLRALREAAQRVTRKGNDRHGIPRCGARRRSFDHPAPMAQASSCSSTPAFKSLPRSRARISVPRSELA